MSCCKVCLDEESPPFANFVRYSDILNPLEFCDVSCSDPFAALFDPDEIAVLLVGVIG